MGASWSFMKAADAISGKEGTLYATINGEVIPVMECKNISAKIQKKKKEFNALGHRGTQHKATGWSGSGSMTIYYVSSRWTKMMIDYATKGIDTYFKLQATNEDPTSVIGKQTITLVDVNIDDDEILKLDVESDFLEKQMNFTFSDVEMPEEFSDLSASSGSGE